MIDFNGPALTGRLVRLEPLEVRHIGLYRVCTEDRASYSYTTVPRSPEQTRDYVRSLMQARVAGDALPFTQIRLCDDVTVGTTRFMSFRHRDADHRPFAAGIGRTWLAASAQRTGINVESKLLLLAYAFEAFQLTRVELRTDARNSKSRAAIAALGARLEGVLRSWEPSLATSEEESLRDTAVYSILDVEWEAVHAALISRLR